MKNLINNYFKYIIKKMNIFFDIIINIRILNKLKIQNNQMELEEYYIISWKNNPNNLLVNNLGIDNLAINIHEDNFSILKVKQIDKIK